jgi:hypothetical protein
MIWSVQLASSHSCCAQLDMQCLLFVCVPACVSRCGKSGAVRGAAEHTVVAWNAFIIRFGKHEKVDQLLSCFSVMRAWHSFLINGRWI